MDVVDETEALQRFFEGKRLHHISDLVPELFWTSNDRAICIRYQQMYINIVLFDIIAAIFIHQSNSLF